jgi:hypothetical protein
MAQSMLPIESFLNIPWSPQLPTNRNGVSEHDLTTKSSLAVNAHAIKFRYLRHYKDRFGNPWVYVRHNGRKIRIKETIGSPEFACAYGDAIHRLNSPGPIDPIRKNETDHTKPGTLVGWRLNISHRLGSRNSIRHRNHRRLFTRTT